MKYLNLEGLKRFLAKLMTKIAEAFDTLANSVDAIEKRIPAPTTADTGKYLRGDGTWAVPPDTKTTVDNSLNASSTNPVQNKVVKAELDKKAPNTLATTTKDGLMSIADKKLLSRMTLTNSYINIRTTENSTRYAALGLYNDDWSYISAVNEFIVEINYDEILNVNTNGIHVSGKCTSSGSDYAKYYEWLDGNTENEDRRGLFVTLDGEKIKIADEDSDYILGIVSAAPGFVENAYEREWHGKYIKDVYGERITQQGDSGSEEYVIDPKYNADEKYIPRSERPEWTYVGLTGELVVRDDGTCEVNGYCRASQGGIATKADTGYRVIARPDDTHIKVLIK